MNPGATPAGIRPGDEAAAARSIRDMFGLVAPRYDLLNRLLSLRIDQYWRLRLVKEVREFLAQPSARVMDLCCGTGDLLLALQAERRRLSSAETSCLIGSDFCRPMLQGLQAKLRRAGSRPALIEADALSFPLPDASLDLITIAYGFRNLANYHRGLQEMYRLLRPGGCLAILEFSQPTRFWGPLFRFYFRSVLPRLGNAISGAGNAYSYLQQSVEKFPSPDELAVAMRERGFVKVRHVSLTGGISVLHLARKN